MRITIRAGVKEGKTTVAAVIARTLMDHGIVVVLDDDNLESDQGDLGRIMRDPIRMGERLSSLRGSKITIVTEQTRRGEEA